jgi:Family of unknown function (DUF5681)
MLKNSEILMSSQSVTARNLTPWKPGQSGNPNGRPLGTRNSFSQAYIRDFHTVWDEAGIAAIRTMAAKNPSGFVAVASKLIPQQVAVDTQASLPGNLSAQDWQVMREIVEAVKLAVPDASSKPPGEVLEYVRARLST